MTTAKEKIAKYILTATKLSAAQADRLLADRNSNAYRGAIKLADKFLKDTRFSYTSFSFENEEVQISRHFSNLVLHNRELLRNKMQDTVRYLGGQSALYEDSASWEWWKRVDKEQFTQVSETQKSIYLHAWSRHLVGDDNLSNAVTKACIAETNRINLSNFVENNWLKVDMVLIPVCLFTLPGSMIFIPLIVVQMFACAAHPVLSYSYDCYAYLFDVTTPNDLLKINKQLSVRVTQANLSALAAEINNAVTAAVPPPAAPAPAAPARTWVQFLQDQVAAQRAQGISI